MIPGYDRKDDREPRERSGQLERDDDQREGLAEVCEENASGRIRETRIGYARPAGRDDTNA